MDEGGLQGEAQAFARIGIVGLGLMGGSLARGLKALHSPPRVTSLSLNPQELEEACSGKVIDEGFSRPEAFFPELDLVVYCTPLETTLALLAEHGKFLNEEAVVTDVVSLKVPVMRAVKELGLESRFVGSHPMTGGESRGFAASRDGLYTGSRVWLVKGWASGDRFARIEGFWRSVGAFTQATSAEEHDGLMAWISHLPQLTSNALAVALHQAGFEKGYLGPGGRDMTRLAGSSPEMWRGLLKFAPTDLTEALRAVEAALTRFRARLEAGESEKVVEEMERTMNWSTEGKWS